LALIEKRLVNLGKPRSEAEGWLADGIASEMHPQKIVAGIVP
jgi:hypothetical protein